jgi:putative DNA methylase
MGNYPKKLIEVALPLPEINDASAYDKMPGIGPHPKGIHHWWARLPLPTARAVLFASVVDDPSSHPENFPTEEMQNAERERLFGIVRELMQKKLHERPEVYAKAREEMLKHTGGMLPPVLDPFAGGGSIPLEAARLGFEAHAADLNPVAVLLNKCNLELVPRWLDRPAVNPEVKDDMFGRECRVGSRGLAEDVRYYGNLIRERAIAKIGHLYPKVKLPKEYGGREVNVIAWLWARTIKCPNPACGAQAPLVRSFWLCRKKPNYVHEKPVLENKNVSFTIEYGGTAEKETTSGKGARCLFCGQILSKAQVREAATNYGIKDIPLATVADIGRGRIYLPSESVCVPVVDKPGAPTIEHDMTNDRRWFSPPLYGWPKFADLFSPRQLTAMVTLSDLVKDVRLDVLADARKAGISDAEADDYAKTITTFLALALDRCADFNNGLCRWTAGNQKVMNLFSRQAIPMVWDFAEANILGDSVGAWQTCEEYVAKCIDVLGKSCNSEGNANQIDAAGAWGDTRGLLVSTDPPYYDNIGYAALSDFFYVWLRRTIGDLYPDLFKTILVPKAPELTAAPERFDGNKEKAKEHFESGFRKAFTTLREKMDARFPLTVYYAFKQEDEKAGSDEDANGDEKGSSNGVDLTTGWETLLDALLGSGFQITATWPVRASQKWRMVAMGTNALASYIVLACRPRSADASQCSRREFLNEMKKELPTALKYLQQGNIAPVDLAQAAIGPGMAVFSRYAKVVESSGKAMTVRTALALINHTLDEVLAEQEAEFDADTRWALAWFEQHGMEEGEFGVAETLSRAKNTAVNGLVQAGIVVARSGKVRLVNRDELPADWDPSSDKRLTVWEVTQHLLRALDQHGESGAADLLRKLGGTVGESARELSYRLHKVCEKKNWSSEALAYNSLVLAWPELTKLATSAAVMMKQETLEF